MIELNRHIEILLLSNDCVIVPDLGGFMAHHVDARYDEQEHLFLPPLRTLGFNPQLKMNDSLLVQSYIEAYDISYPEAYRRIQSEVAELRQHLETEGMFELNGIGVLSINEEGNLLFEPCEAGILTPQLYGLSSFEMMPRQVKGLTISKKVPELKDENTITIKMSWLRNIAAAAAAAVAFLMITSPISNSQMPTTVQQSAFLSISHAQQDAQAPDTAEATQQQEAIEEAPIADQAEEQQTAEQVTSEAATRYCIVLASQVSQRNAEDFIARLSKKGFDKAYIIDTKFRRVVYGSYATEEEASSQLRSLRSQSSIFSESWVMEIK